jgi:peptidoglycan/xylan/chitin deacetylase (PgdA/CDA1 family)
LDPVRSSLRARLTRLSLAGLIALAGCASDDSGIGPLPDGSSSKNDLSSNMPNGGDMASNNTGDDMSGNMGTDDMGGGQEVDLSGPRTMIPGKGGCNGGTCLNPTCQANGTAAAIGMYPDTGFDAQPSFIPNDVIIPTFDDVPDGANSPPDPVYGVGGWTHTDMDFFKANNMHVDMFINTNNWCGDVLQDSDCTQAIVDILTNHNPANHTIHHVHIGIAGTASDPGCADATSCAAELDGVEALVNSLSAGGIPHMTRFRAPYGEPFQAQGTGLAMAQTLVAKYAVQVGWNLDSGDSTCDSTTAPCFTGQQIANNVTQLIGTPGTGQRWGILLMHGTYPWTHDALPILFGTNGYLSKNHFRVGTVEDAICWKYGKHSWDIVAQLNNTTRQSN